MVETAKRFGSLPENRLGTLVEKKRALVARGMDIIDLGAGDADLPPPAAAVEALAAAARNPAMSRYGFAAGLSAYREAVAAFMRVRFGLSVDPAREVVPLIGSKEGIAHLAFAYLGPGDLAVVPDPGYIAYEGGTLLADAQPYRFPLTAERSFLVELEVLPEDVARRTRLVYLNYPNNPTGAVAPREYLERVVAWCRERAVLLAYDNAYSEIAFDGYRPPSILEIAGAGEVAIEFHSLSKTYNMTGWRCGWAVARPEIASALARVKSLVDTGSFLAVQAAGAAALQSWAEFVPGNVAVFKARRDAAVAAFRRAGFECEVPRATMYLWLRVPSGLTSGDFAERLLMEEGVLVMPGSAFGDAGEGFFRLSFVTSEARIAEAARRAARLLSRGLTGPTALG
ncbi:MAG TPA: aminotransferase class I/II-fold pyridoxal phosphate-dependent enzyme [Vicinamibacteria bacterium]